MLDDETNLGCTTMVRGFHNHIIEWCIKLRNERRTIIPARTTDCTSLYNRSDRARFGEPEGVPCKRGDLRLMMPSIIYGSRTQGQPTGRAIQAHYIGIKADGITLEHEGLPSLSSLGECHRQRQTPTRTAHGERNPDSVGDQTFPATSLISGVSAVGDALQGLRRWDDWEVVEERNVLLGPNRQDAELRINETRKKLVEAYKCAVHKIERLERAAFGANSYFVGLAKAKKAHRTQAHKGQDAIIIE